MMSGVRRIRADEDRLRDPAGQRVHVGAQVRRADNDELVAAAAHDQLVLARD